MTNAAWALAAVLAGSVTGVHSARAGGAAQAESAVPGAAIAPAVQLTKPGENGCPPTAAPNVPPVYPKALVKKGVQGTVILRAALDTCGVVKTVSVAKSSRIAELDAAALQAVRQWRVTEVAGATAGPDGLIEGLMPVQFQIEDRDDRLWDDPVAVQASWCDSMSASVPAKDDQVPQYIGDSQPLVGTVEQIVRGLPAWATYRPTMGAEERYHVERLHVQELYRVMLPESGMHPAVIRKRRVHDGVQALWVTSYVCEAGAAPCARLKELAERAGTQWVQSWPVVNREIRTSCAVPTAAR